MKNHKAMARIISSSKLSADLFGMFKKLAILILIQPLLGVFHPAIASTFFFPDMSPSITRESPPEWLKNGAAGDGYVTVTSEVIPIASCSKLSSTSFWGSEKQQLILSVGSHGFKTTIDSVDVPIATFDGRENSAECASLSTGQQQVVPMTPLGSRSLFNPGKLSITLNVRSSNDSQNDFIGSAKLLLGAASLVASGGTSAIVTGATATVGNSVLSDTEARANKLLKGMTDSKVPVSLNWSQLRNGIKSIDIPVYRAEQTFGSVTDIKIQELQSNPKAEKVQLFTVRLDFSYFRSLFYPSVEDIANLGARENLSAERVLNTQIPGKGMNFMQALNSGAPSQLMLISNSSGVGLAKACSTGFEKLKALGLDNPDIAIVMKSFIDEARGTSSWYSDLDLVKSCFSSAPKIQAYLYEIYGSPTRNEPH